MDSVIYPKECFKQPKILNMIYLYLLFLRVIIFIIQVTFSIASIYWTNYYALKYYYLDLKKKLVCFLYTNC